MGRHTRTEYRARTTQHSTHTVHIPTNAWTTTLHRRRPRGNTARTPHHVKRHHRAPVQTTPHTLSHTHQTSVSACTRKRKVVPRHHTTARDKLLFQFVWKSTSSNQVFAMNAPHLTCALQSLMKSSQALRVPMKKQISYQQVVELPLQSHTFGLLRRSCLACA